MHLKAFVKVEILDIKKNPPLEEMPVFLRPEAGIGVPVS